MNSSQPSPAHTPGPVTNPPTGEAPPHRVPPGFSLSPLLFGAEGLRALWGILVFLSLFYFLRICILPIAATLVPPAALQAEAMVSRAVYAFDGAALLCVAGAMAIVSMLERRVIWRYGLSPGRSLRNFAAGLAWGVALLSLLVAVLRFAGLLVFDARLLSGSAMLREGATWLGGFLTVAFYEELLVRGYLQFTLPRLFIPIYRWVFGARSPVGLGFWTTALLLSFVFGFGHRTNPGESPLGLVSAGLVGLVFSFSLWRTGSLWWAIGFHASWDWAQSFLFGVADSGIVAQGRLFRTHPVGRPILSGGLTGPEGSIFVLAILALAALVIRLTLPSPDDQGRPPDTRGVLS
jgi:uncharacterized protein